MRGVRSTNWREKPRGAMKTIAVRLVRELERKLSAAPLEKHQGDFALYRRALAHKRHGHDKIYSLHEPHLYCVAKGKKHK